LSVLEETEERSVMALILECLFIRAD